jgi:hypothetical protein
MAVHHSSPLYRIGIGLLQPCGRQAIVFHHVQVTFQELKIRQAIPRGATLLNHLIVAAGRLQLRTPQVLLREKMVDVMKLPNVDEGVKHGKQREHSSVSVFYVEPAAPDAGSLQKRTYQPIPNDLAIRRILRVHEPVFRRLPTINIIGNRQQRAVCPEGLLAQSERVGEFHRENDCPSNVGPHFFQCLHIRATEILDLEPNAGDVGEHKPSLQDKVFRKIEACTDLINLID